MFGGVVGDAIGVGEDVWFLAYVLVDEVAELGDVFADAVFVVFDGFAGELAYAGAVAFVEVEGVVLD